MYCFPGGDGDKNILHSGTRTCSGEILFASKEDYSCGRGTYSLNQGFSLDDTIKHFNGDTYAAWALSKHHNKFQDPTTVVSGTKYNGAGRSIGNALNNKTKTKKSVKNIFIYL